MMKFIIFALLFITVQAGTIQWKNLNKRVLKVPRTIENVNSVEGKIIGGWEATPGQFPHQAGIFMDGTSFCGGSLIAEQVVLTAAHCAEFVGSFEIHLGAQDIQNSNELNHQVIYSSTYTIHAMWDSFNINHDIAVIFLTYPVNGTGIAPISLPRRSQENDTFAGYNATVSGWGATSDSMSGINDQLKFANVTVISNTECINVYGSTINENKICIDTAGGTASTCFGDSGGPLAYYEDNGIPIIIGITSFVAGDGCQAGYPAGFTRVTYYLDWLETNAFIPIRP